MCGILFSNIKNLSFKKFSDSLYLMNHRGPDFQSTKTFPDDVFLGHNRLQILDLNERSNQPFSCKKGEYHIIFNGEIFNFQELKKKFNVETRTTSDTEILLELYLLFGEKALDHLNGMFTFVIFNSITGEVFAARDRLGIKPLYYHELNNEIIFSSELSPILNLVENTKIDILGLRQYLKARAFFNCRTLYSNIKMFPAGSFYKDGKIKSYWDLPINIPKKAIDDDEIKFLIEDSVKLCCISDVPVGVLLSGGLDSTIISTLANKTDTWTIGFESQNEFMWSRIVAKGQKSNYHEILIDQNEFLEIGRDLIRRRKEPLSVPNEILIYKMSKAIKLKNTVILSGEGADELFFGYDRIYKWAMNNEWDLNEFDKYYSYGSHNDFEILEDILSPVSQCINNIDKVGLFFQKYHLHGLLRRLDNSTMMCSIEARVPFVDHRLIECLHSIDPKEKIFGEIVKAPLKRIFKDRIPIETINRQKVGFPVPLDKIFGVDNNGMDMWLEFNMETLFKENWKDIKAEIFLKQ